VGADRHRRRCQVICARPSWQQGVDPGYGDHRLVPDTAWNAAVNGGVDVYITAYPAFNWGNTTGCWTIFGGTSAATPQTAALVALVNAARASQGKHLDPLLYKVRAVSAVVGEEPGSRPARLLVPAALAPRPSGGCSGRRARLDGRTVYTPRVA
jgi:subtilase family serine protease